MSQTFLSCATIPIPAALPSKPKLYIRNSLPMNPKNTKMPRRSISFKLENELIAFLQRVTSSNHVDQPIALNADTLLKELISLRRKPRFRRCSECSCKLDTFGFCLNSIKCSKAHRRVNQLHRIDAFKYPMHQAYYRGDDILLTRALMNIG
jgi:hypothetical protein